MLLLYGCRLGHTAHEEDDARTLILDDEEERMVGIKLGWQAIKRNHYPGSRCRLRTFLVHLNISLVYNLEAETSYWLYCIQKNYVAEKSIFSNSCNYVAVGLPTRPMKRTVPERLSLMTNKKGWLALNSGGKQQAIIITPVAAAASVPSSFTSI